MPLAPALLSTTTACLVSWVIALPSARANWSVALPAANGTMKLIGLAGKLCASAVPAYVVQASAVLAKRGGRQQPPWGANESGANRDHG